ncbi:MAG: tetratricopeptide repeat protein, partial [Bacteroidota bacterium]
GGRGVQFGAVFLALLPGFFSCKNSSSQADPAAAAAPATGNPAIDGLTQKIQKSPSDASLYAARGATYYENENFDEGIADLEHAIALDSSKAEYYHALADMYLDYYKSRMGLNVMERAAATFPKRVPTLLKLAEFQLILKQYNQALFTLERIRVIDPLNAEMLFSFGNVFREMGKPDQAITAYQSAVENDPDLVDAWISLGQLLADKGSTQAIKYFDNALRADSTSIHALHAKADYLAQKKNDLSGAVRLYKKVNSLDPQFEEGYYNLGLIYLDMDSVEQAYKSFDRAIQVAPSYAEAYFHRGVAAEKKGDRSQAKADYENVLRIDPEFAAAKEGLKRLGGGKG